jgi:hypothetical protein
MEDGSGKFGGNNITAAAKWSPASRTVSFSFTYDGRTVVSSIRRKIFRLSFLFRLSTMI